MAEAGGRAFFCAEIERLMDRLYGTALRLTRSPADAEDLVAEAVAKAWAGFDRLAERGAFAAWLFRILVNTYISEHRRKRPEVLEADAAMTDSDRFSLFEELHQPFLLWWSTPEQDLINKLLREDLERAFDQLPAPFREVAVLIEINGNSYAEAAALLGVPVGTVRSRLSRARAALQRALWQEAEARGLIHKECVHG
jgi:RNA polymerase sigma-70 factor (ECF subfamily)